MALLHCCIQFPDSVPRPWELISMICEILGGLVQTRDHQRIVLEAYQAECASTSGAVTEYILIEQLVGVLQMPRVSGPEHVLSAISALVRANTRLASRTQMITSKCFIDTLDNIPSHTRQQHLTANPLSNCWANSSNVTTNLCE